MAMNTSLRSTETLPKLQRRHYQRREKNRVIHIQQIQNQQVMDTTDTAWKYHHRMDRASTYTTGIGIHRGNDNDDDTENYGRDHQWRDCTIGTCNCKEKAKANVKSRNVDTTIVFEFSPQ
jgi:hypothetical protein